MMKKIVLVLFVGLLAFSANAQDKKAKIKFTTTTVDYGKVVRGGDGVRAFEFTNTGNAPLIISKVKSSCGCTIPKKPDGPIMPGKKGVIEVEYDTKRPAGPIRKAITVISNAETPTTVLKIKGELIEAKVAVQ